MCPELIKEEKYEKGVDWWALGAILYELLIGITPFFNLDTFIALEKIKRAPVSFP